MHASRDRILPRINPMGWCLLAFALVPFTLVMILMAAGVKAEEEGDSANVGVEIMLPYNPGAIAIMLDDNTRASAGAAKTYLEVGDIANFCLNIGAAEDFELALSVIASYTLVFTERDVVDPPYLTELRDDFAEKCNH